MSYKTVLTDSIMSDLDITSHETDKFTEEYDCENDVDCFTQPTDPNDCVLLNLAVKKTVKYFVGLIQEKRPDGYNTRFLRKLLTS
jgi:hypothetical protein